jgi:small subunit ribosomal protein S2
MSTQDTKLSLMSLYEVGAHRGNKKSRLNPRLKDKVYGVENGLSIIDLVETKKSIEKITSFLNELGRKRKQLLIVGTSKHLINITSDTSARFNNGPMPYVNYRWLGGTLTNWSTIKKTLDSLNKLRSIEADETFLKKLSKNEQLGIKREKIKLEKFFAGLVSLKSNKPGAVLVLDALNNPIAIREAETMKIPVIALTNTGTVSLPVDVSYTCVANINSIKTMGLLLDKFVEAYNSGAQSFVKEQEENKQKGDQKK